MTLQKCSRCGIPRAGHTCLNPKPSGPSSVIVLPPELVAVLTKEEEERTVIHESAVVAVVEVVTAVAKPAADPASHTGPGPYKCSRCGQPKKAHVCTADVLMSDEPQPPGSTSKEPTAAQARPRRSAAPSKPPVEAEADASEEDGSSEATAASGTKQLTGTKRKRYKTEPPLSPEAVRRLAESEGLPLIVGPTQTGFRGVSVVTKRPGATLLFALKINKKHAGVFPTAEQAALAYSRHIGREAALVEAAAAKKTLAQRALLQTPEGRDMTAAEVEAAAAAEGLELERCDSSTGFKHVAAQANGGNRFYALPKVASGIGSQATPEAVALALARQKRDAAATAPPCAEAERQLAGAAKLKRFAAIAAAAANTEARAERRVAALRAKLQEACEELQTARARALSTAAAAAAVGVTAEQLGYTAIGDVD